MNVPAPAVNIGEGVGARIGRKFMGNEWAGIGLVGESGRGTHTPEVSMRMSYDSRVLLAA